MKKNEIIELNGKEYTVELNRETFLQIDKLCNIEKTMQFVHKDLYEYMDDKELDDNFDLNNIIIDEDKLEEEILEKEQALEKTIERSFLIWLYPNHKLKPSEVKELLKPYFEDNEKSSWIAEKWGQYIQECIEMREQYTKERKNLKALANKTN